MTTSLPAVSEPSSLQLLQALEGCGTATATSLVLTDPDLPYDRWAALGRMFGQIKNSTSWWLGDWILFGENGLYEQRYAQAESETGLAHQTLTNYSSVCRRVPHNRRRENVSFSIHAEVAALSPNEQRHWLARAEKESLTREEVRELLRATPRDLPAGETEGEKTAASSAVGNGALGTATVPVFSPSASVDAVLDAIRAVTRHAEPLDEKRVSVLRKDIEMLQAFLGEE